MENNIDSKALMKPRNAGACIKDGILLLAGNFKSVFKASWHAAAAYSLISSALGTLYVMHMPRITAGMMGGIPEAPTELYATMLTIILLIVTGGIAELLFYSCGVSLLRFHKEKAEISKAGKWLSFDLKAAWRTLKIQIPCCLVVIAGIAAVTFACPRLAVMLGGNPASAATAAVILCGYVAVCLLMMPMTIGAMRYMLEDGVRLTDAVRYGYGKGIARIPLITGVVFVSLCLIALSGALLSLPAQTLVTANWMAYLGTVNGDPLGMPGYMTVLTATTFAITGFIQAYVRMPLVFTTYYLYGSIECRTQAQEKDETTQKESNK